MKPKKSAKKEPLLKSDLSFEELIEGAFNDKSFKKGKSEKSGMKKLFVLTASLGKPKKKKATKKVAKKKAAKKPK